MMKGERRQRLPRFSDVAVVNAKEVLALSSYSSCRNRKHVCPSKNRDRES